MRSLNVGVSDKVVMPWVHKKKRHMDCSDEGEAVAIAAGFFYATGRKANVFMSADGFCNALNFITSWIIPEGIAMHLVISTGRKEPPHLVMTNLLPKIIALLPHDAAKLSFEIVRQ